MPRCGVQGINRRRVLARDALYGRIGFLRENSDMADGIGSDYGPFRSGGRIRPRIASRRNLFVSLGEGITETFRPHQFGLEGHTGDGRHGRLWNLLSFGLALARRVSPRSPAVAGRAAWPASVSLPRGTTRVVHCVMRSERSRLLSRQALDRAEPRRMLAIDSDGERYSPEFRVVRINVLFLIGRSICADMFWAFSHHALGPLDRTPAKSSDAASAMGDSVIGSGARQPIGRRLPRRDRRLVLSHVLSASWNEGPLFGPGHHRFLPAR